MWRSGEMTDRKKYAELMEEKEFHSDKGAVSGSLLDSKLGLQAPQRELNVSSSLLDSLLGQSGGAAEEAVRAAHEAKVKSKQLQTQTQEPQQAEELVRVEQSDEQRRAWAEAQQARQAREDARAAKRRKKREKSRSKKQKGPGGAAAHAVEAAPTDDEADDGEGSACVAASEPANAGAAASAMWSVIRRCAGAADIVRGGDARSAFATFDEFKEAGQ